MPARWMETGPLTFSVYDLSGRGAVPRTATALEIQMQTIEITIVGKNGFRVVCLVRERNEQGLWRFGWQCREIGFLHWLPVWLGIIPSIRAIGHDFSDNMTEPLPNLI